MDHHDHAHHMDMDMGHGGHAPARCSMNMLFTWSTQNLCIVFRSWRITNTFNLLVSLLLIILLCAGYEAVRELSRRYEASCAKRLESVPIADGLVDESSSLLRLGSRQAQTERKSEVVKAFLYGVQVFYSFFIMLLFMTYNGWVMIAVAVGAMVGHLMFGVKTSSTKSVACH